MIKWRNRGSVLNVLDLRIDDKMTGYVWLGISWWHSVGTPNKGVNHAVTKWGAMSALLRAVGR